MRVFLVRHAEAAPGDPDELRPLTEAGRTTARLLGEQLAVEHPDAVVILILAPSTSDLEERLRSRGDSEDHVRRRLASTPGEVERGRACPRPSAPGDQG